MTSAAVRSTNSASANRAEGAGGIRSVCGGSALPPLPPEPDRTLTAEVSAEAEAVGGFGLFTWRMACCVKSVKTQPKLSSANSWVEVVR